MKKTFGKYSVAHKPYECMYCHLPITINETYKYTNGRKYHRQCWDNSVPTGYEKLIELLEANGPLFSDEIPKEYNVSSTYRLARIHGLPILRLQWNRGGNSRGDREKSRRFLLFYLDKDKSKALRRIKEKGHSSKGKTFAYPILGTEE